MNVKKQSRLRRAKKTRMKIRDLQIKDRNLIRLSISKTPRHISVQALIVDALAKTAVVVASASTLEKDIRTQCKYTGNKDAATIVGKELAARLLATKMEGLPKIAFDRSGYLYHGRVKALADAAREGGLEF